MRQGGLLVKGAGFVTWRSQVQSLLPANRQMNVWWYKIQLTHAL